MDHPNALQLSLPLINLLVGRDAFRNAAGYDIVWNTKRGLVRMSVC